MQGIYCDEMSELLNPSRCSLCIFISQKATKCLDKQTFYCITKKISHSFVSYVTGKAKSEVLCIKTLLEKGRKSIFEESQSVHVKQSMREKACIFHHV